MSWVLAVGFGTTFMAAAVREEGREPTLLLIGGERGMPSLAMLNEDGKLVVGHAAEAEAALDPVRAKWGDTRCAAVGATGSSSSTSLVRSRGGASQSR